MGLVGVKDLLIGELLVEDCFSKHCVDIETIGTRVQLHGFGFATPRLVARLSAEGTLPTIRMTPEDEAKWWIV